MAHPRHTINTSQKSRLHRFRDRLRALIGRRKLAAPSAGLIDPPEVVVAVDEDPVQASGIEPVISGQTAASELQERPEPELQPGSERVARRTNARTVEGSARSTDGATSPWLLLPAERNFRLYVPPHVSQKNGGDTLPLVVMIHGCRETAEEFERGTRMNAIADREGFAVLYPDQATFANIRRCWNWFEPNTAAGNGECAIILEMIREARKRATLDRSRVCVAGMSSGGAIAGLLAYHHPDVFAAVAVHSGLPPMMPPSAAAAISAMKKGVRIDTELLSESYWNTHEVLPPALMVLHGDDDETVTEKNATSMVRLWEALFESAPQARPLTRSATEVASAEHTRSYSQIDQLREDQVVISGLRIHGLAHSWSGGDASLPFNDAKGPDASELIWRFFEAQRRAP